MRRICRAAIALAFAVAFYQPALAIDPDDQPWDEIDRILKEGPQTITPDTEAAANKTANDAEVPGGPDRDPEPGIENDRQLSDRRTDPSADPSNDRLAPDDPNQGTIAAPKEEPAKAQEPNAEPTPAVAAPAPAATPPPAEQTAAAPPAAPPVADQLILPVKQLLEKTSPNVPADEATAAFDDTERTALLNYYGAHNGQPLWVTRTGLSPAGAALIEEFSKATEWGLTAKDVEIPAVDFANTDYTTDERLAEEEVKLSRAAMLYARQARGGRIANPTEQLSSYLDRKPQLIEPAKVIEALAAAPDKAAYLRSLHPKHPQFERLRQKLAELRAGSEQDEFEKIPSSGPKLSPGKSHPQIALIRQRLKVSSPGLKPDGTSADDNYYDEALARAVVQFKEKHGIEPATPAITNKLRAQLNQDDRPTEAMLLANMEQWRWMPDDLGAKHVEVNIPEFMVRVMKDNAVLHSERVVTGKAETQTPIFSDKMRTIVFNPSWIVPHSIMINELLPKLRAGGNPIARQGLEIKRNDRLVNAMDVNWNRSDIRLYHIYQPPGPSNVLGVVKFLFPNKHAVYLHDTPSKSLFNENVRTFSHGCVRVRNPVQLAEVILAEDKNWDSRKVKDLIARGPGDNDIALDTPMPVHITYFTAWVEDDGTVKTFQDVYGHEKRITLALQGRWNEIVKNRDHLLPPEVGKVAGSRDNEWADPDGWSDRRDRDSRVTYQSVPPPNYKKGKSVGDMLQQVFGGF